MERSFWLDALLVVVTLGFYIPYWFYERNKRLREAHPTLEMPDNLPWLIGGLAMTILGAWLGWADPFFSAVVQIGAIAVFTVGVHILAMNGESAADARRIDWTVPVPFVSGLFGGAFLMVQVGNMFESFYARAFALLLLGALPFVYYYVWQDLALLIPERPTTAAAA